MSKTSATYQQLQNVLTRPGCPICALGEQAAHSYLDGLLWESVNDPGIRERLAGSLGFCGRHSRELLTFPGERLGVAILQRAVLREAVNRLHQNPAASPPGFVQSIQDKLSGRIDRTAPESGPSQSMRPCPACVQQDQAEALACETLLTHFTGDLDGPLLSAGGLCWPHLQRALESEGETPVRAALVQLHRRAWEAVAAQLDELIRKNDHRFRAEKITEQERSAIDRSIAILTGAYPLR